MRSARLGSWSGRRLVLAWAVAIALGALVQVASAAVAEGRPLLDTRPGWTVEEARLLLEELGAGGRAAWGWLLPLDVAFGVGFGIAAAAIFARLPGRSPSPVGRAPRLAGRRGTVGGQHRNPRHQQVESAE